FPGSKSPGSGKDVMCYETLLRETVRCCGFSTELFIKTSQGGSREQETKVSGRRDGRGWTNGANRCSTVRSVGSGFAVNHSGRLASRGSNDDRPECFHEQKPPTEPINLHPKTFQPHPYQRDEDPPGLDQGTGEDSNS